MKAQFEKREGDADKSRAAEEVFRLSQELANSRKALEMKNKELSMALASFSEHQRNAEARDAELRQATGATDEKIQLLEKEKTELMNQLSDFKTKAATDDTQLSAVKEQLKETKDELSNLQEELKNATGDGSRLQNELSTEKALRQRAEVKEEEERRERIAASAQLMAIEQNMGRVQVASQEDVSKIRTEFEAKVAQLETDLAEREGELKDVKVVKSKLEGEVQTLKGALEASQANLEEVSQLAKKAGEVEELKQTIKNLEEDHGKGKATYEERITTLEQELKVRSFVLPLLLSPASAASRTMTGRRCCMLWSWDVFAGRIGQGLQTRRGTAQAPEHDPGVAGQRAGVCSPPTLLAQRPQGRRGGVGDRREG